MADCSAAEHAESCSRDMQNCFLGHVYNIARTVVYVTPFLGHVYNIAHTDVYVTPNVHAMLLAATGQAGSQTQTEIPMMPICMPFLLTSATMLPL